MYIELLPGSGAGQRGQKGHCLQAGPGRLPNQYDFYIKNFNSDELTCSFENQYHMELL